MHGTDIHIGVTGDFPHRPDEPGTVAVVAEKKIRTGCRHDIQPVIVDAHDMRFTVHDGPGHCPAAFGSDYLHRQQADVVGAGSFLLLDNGEAALGRDNIAVNDVYSFLTNAFQQTTDYRRLECVSVEISYIAVVLDADGLRLSLGEFVD